MYRCVRDDWQLCLVRVISLITHLQLKKMSVINQSAHVAITLQLLEMSSITTPNQTISNFRTRFKFFKVNISEFTYLNNERNQIWKFCANELVLLNMDCDFLYLHELVTYYAVSCSGSLWNLTQWSCDDATPDVLLLTCYVRGCNRSNTLYPPQHNKICLWGFRQSEIQTSLLSYRD